MVRPAPTPIRDNIGSGGPLLNVAMALSLFACMVMTCAVLALLLGALALGARAG